MTSPATIAVAYASVGSGHRIAAEAIAEELRGRPDVARVELLDVLAYSSRRLTGDRLATTFTGSWARVYDFAWASPAIGAAARTVSGILYELIMPDFRRALSELGPDVIVCTHATPAVIAAREVRAGRASWKLVGSATDFGLHGYWPIAAVDLMCVADEASARTALAREARSDSVRVTGIAVRPQFAKAYDLDRTSARACCDLPQDGRVVVALAGSQMAGPYEHFKRALAAALPRLAALPDTHLVVVAGSDQRFADEMRRSAARLADENSAHTHSPAVTVTGFIDPIAPLLAAADLVVAKAGGSTCAECMALGAPLALIGPSVGQEAANVSALTAAGAARYAADPRELAHLIEQCTEDSDSLAAMAAAARSLGHPGAARDVADAVVALGT